MFLDAPIVHVEAFHLVFLRVLETKLDRSRYVVKGGVNLRAWFGSARYSEDLDVDAFDVETYALKETVDKLLASPPFLTLMRAQGLEMVRASRPKQTDTTQRWKFEIQPQGVPGGPKTLPLHTKIEFSKRGTAETRDEYVLEPVLPQIVRHHSVPAPTANHYTAAAAARQKISALAGRAVTQARDIWDLEHLFRVSGADPRPLPPSLVTSLDHAIGRAMDMPYSSFKAQVVPFLEAEHQDLFGTPEAWERLRELVVDRLLEMKS